MKPSIESVVRASSSALGVRPRVEGEPGLGTVDGAVEATAEAEADAPVLAGCDDELAVEDVAGAAVADAGVGSAGADADADALPDAVWTAIAGALTSGSPSLAPGTLSA